MGEESDVLEPTGLEVELTERFKDFIVNFRDDSGRFKYMDRLRRMISFESRSLVIEFADLYKHDTRLAEALIDEPDEVLRRAGDAIRDIVALEHPALADKRRFIARVAGLFDTIRIRDIRSEHVGKMIQFEGIITRMHPIRSRMIRSVFRHEKCGSEFKWPQEENEVIADRLERPGLCPVCGEGGGKFVLLKEKSEYIDWQRITVQERPEDVPGGQMPRSIEVHLTYDLVDTARPGDRVSITGVVRLESFSPTSPLYEMYVEANSVRVSERALEEVSITREDEELIREMARDPWVKDKIIASIAPSIHGHWDLKEAIALLLFGGVPKVMPDGTTIRGDIHVLFIGDPGVAKSLTYGEHILVIDGEGLISVRPIGEVVEEYMDKHRDKVVTLGETQQLLLEEAGVEMYTIAVSPTELKPSVRRVRALIRHKAPDRVVVLRTESGRRAIVTEDHSIMGLGGGQPGLSALRPAEALAKEALIPAVGYLAPFRRRIITHVALGGRMLELGWHLGYLTGFFLGRGSISPGPGGDSVVIEAPNEEVAGHLAHIAGEKLGFEASASEDGEAGTGSYSFVSSDKGLVEWFKSCLTKPRQKGGGGPRGHYRVVPQVAYNAPEEFIEGLIAGLVESKGSKGGPRPNGGKACIRPVDPPLAYGISTLLSILGHSYIISEGPQEQHGATRYHEICIVGPVAGAASSRGSPSPEAGRSREIPAGPAGERALLEVADLRASPEGGLSTLSSPGYTSLPGMTVGGPTVTWDRVESVQEVDIGDVEPGREGYVYDISVEGYENFAGGLGLLFLHNSQLLQSTARIAPRSVITTGKGSTAAGLTAAVLRDSKTGEYFLEAGALVLADGGVAIIDELDKMRPEDRVAIHEAMEQQTISISKAGIVARLNARASVLAAGNPRYGVYDQARNFIENVNLPPTILSRFDLIFVVRDVLGEERDRRLARYILEAHRNVERFKPPIDPDTLRKYIIYAKRYVRPRLSDRAKDLIEEFFVEMRNSALQYKAQRGEQAPIPITARQLEAIVRLAEAHARMSLREEVTEEDAAAAVRIVSSFLESVGLDLETGMIDVGMIMTGASLSTRRLMSVVMDYIKKLGEGERCVRVRDLLDAMGDRDKYPEERVREALEKLRNQGLIYEKRSDCWMTVD